ncbi:NlpC/P60 family protein [Sporosarcina aquimarina]|uniref:C40 family peptidase n=1 Tax=Sporosarcina aquimarina TaxID=114975 RepID=UPI00203B3D55|nr:C40 family peptidase [Sporosarcina aquimarina]MCM3756382.1 NlpC/P60 family protein [Sporosarcina aquimarina]
MKLKRLLALGIASLVISTSVPSMASAATLSATNLVNTAKNYIGTPYRYGGTSLTSGIDCSAYTQLVYKKSGSSLPRTTGQQYKQGKAVSKSNLTTGDLVFFNTSGRGVSHVGIYIGSSKFIHASTSKGVTISSLNDPYYWKSRYVGAKRPATFGETSVASKPTPTVTYATRGQVANIVVKTLGLHRTGSNMSFSDVNSKTPYYNEIMAAAEAGIFSGSNSGRFNPNDPLTRSQMAKVLTDAFDLSTSTEVPFKDVPSDYWALKYVGALYSNNVTAGYTNGNFGVDDKVKIQDMQRFLDNLK